MFFACPSGPRIDIFGNALFERHPAARSVRVLPMLNSRCCIKTLVEYWTLMTDIRRIPADALAVSERQHAQEGQQEQQQENETSSTSSRRRRRRKGELVLAAMPYPVLVIICKFLQHQELISFDCNKMTRWKTVANDNEPCVIAIVEEAVLDMHRAVSFYLRISIDGVVVPNSSFFLNPSMVIGCSWAPTKAEWELLTRSNSGDAGDDNNDAEKNSKRDKERKKLMQRYPRGFTDGIVLFDVDLTRLRAQMCSSTLLDGIKRVTES